MKKRIICHNFLMTYDSSRLSMPLKRIEMIIKFFVYQLFFVFHLDDPQY